MDDQLVKPAPAPGNSFMSVTIGKLSAALSKLQSEIGQPNKSKTAKVPMKNGGQYSYKYADLADCIRIAQPLLAKYELAVIQTVKTGKGFASVKTLVGHSSGEFISETVLLPVGDDKPQSYGSAITYARRYGYCAPLGISPDEDDDGSLAQDSKSSAPRNEKPKGNENTDKQGPPVYTTISEPQQKRLFAIASKAGWTDQEIKQYVSTKFGVQTRKEIRVKDYKEICETIETKSFNQVMGHIEKPLETIVDVFPEELPPWPEY
jgi:hypothetical protein